MAKLVRYWWPGAVDIPDTTARLSRFYAEREDYHAMTRSGNKIVHPHIRLLLSLLRPSDRCVEFGCGGGVVLRGVEAHSKQAIGIDIGMFALQHVQTLPGHHDLLMADVARVPLPDGCADVSYSTEVLEHVWNPEAVLREMIRVVKPGGIVFMTTPNGYSMDLHLKRRASIRAFNEAAARLVNLRVQAGGRIFENIPPDLEVFPAYPDCDMITRVQPQALEKFAAKNGCRVERLETYFFQQDKAENDADRRRFAALEQHPFYRYHGDHILFVGRKL